MSEFKAKLPVLLSIAGSDNTGGAGIQADIKTACKMDVYCATAITAVTAQSHHGVAGVEYVGANMLRKQLDTFMQGYRPDAVKIGMIPNAEAAKIIEEAINRYNWKNVVLDPIIKATCDGDSLTGNSHDTAKAIYYDLFPLCDIITPNIPEYEYFTVEYGLDAFRKAKAMLLKGGHGDEVNSVDRLHIFGESPLEFDYTSNKIKTRHTHGSGCVLSSAIACGLAKGENIQTAVAHAKHLIDDALRKGAEFSVTESYGPLNLL